mgnify:CR=1 FL=1
MHQFTIAEIRAKVSEPLSDSWGNSCLSKVLTKMVEGIGTLESNSILVHDFLLNWMIFFHFSSTWFSDL